MGKLIVLSLDESERTIYVEKPQGKPALVPVTDKRPEMNTAQEDFKED